MEILINYWYVILVAFILILLIVLGYLMDKEKKDKNKNINFIDDSDFFKDEENEIIKKLNNKDLKNKTINSFVDGKETTKDEKFSDVVYVDNKELSEGTDLDFDEDFSRVVPKKELFDDELKKSIDDIKLEPIEIKENKITKNDITLPDIEITKK